MAQLKTQKTAASVEDFLGQVADEGRRRDCLAVAAMMHKATQSEPRMWGSSIVGFGTYRYASGGETREWMMIGFSPRKSDLTLYIMPGFDAFAPLMKKLGKHKSAKSCLYLKNLSDVDPTVLQALIDRSVAWMRKKYAA